MASTRGSQRLIRGPVRYLVALALTLLPAHALAQGLVVQPAGDSGSAQLLPLSALDVTASLTDLAATLTEARDYHLESGAEGDGSASLELTFYRALTDAAAVAAIRVDGQPLSGRVLPPAEADALRIELVELLGDPAPLRDFGTPLFVSATWSHTPEETGGSPFGGGGWFNSSVRVELDIEQALEPQGTMRGIHVPVDWHRQPAGSVSVQVSATTEATLRSLYSPYHTLSVVRDGAHHQEGSYRGYGRCTAFDVQILLSTGDEPVRLDLLPYRDATDGDPDGTFLALLSTPPASAELGSVVPRDVVLVVDRSGSMQGEKIVQARAALTSVLGGLRPADRVTIVSFATDVDSLVPVAEPADSAHLTEAQAFVDAVVDGGGTNIHDALSTAFDALPPNTTHARYVVFMTDGQATEGITETDKILAMARARNELGARIFAFGIGDSVNTVLLDSLGLDSGGAALYIRPGQAVDAAVAAFFAQITDPLLTNPVLDLSAVGGHDVFPVGLADLFAEQTIAVLGRFDRPGDGRITLSGDVNGAAVVHTFDVHFPSHALANGFVPRIWARRQVGTLLQEIKLGDTDPALVEQAMALAHRYGVVTEFTYFLLDEEGDMVMTWSDVPVAASGSAAVDTSASISSYSSSGTVDDPAAESQDTWIRYHQDRTFPKVGGWFTDTATTDGTAAAPAASSSVDLHFGSDLYWRLVQEERSSGAPGFLSVGANVRFVLGGRHFRVADPEHAADFEESATLPALGAAPVSAEASVALVNGENDNPGEPSTVLSPPDVPTVIDARPSIAGEPTGCSSSNGSQGIAAAWCLVLAAWGIGRRRRRSEARS